jgi:hypothetical protein
LTEYLTGDGEPEIFVAIVVTRRKILNDSIFEQCFGKPIIMLNAPEAPFCRCKSVHASYSCLSVVASAPQPEIHALFQSGSH